MSTNKTFNRRSNRRNRTINRRSLLRNIGLVSSGTLGGFLLGRVSNSSSNDTSDRGSKLDAPQIFKKCVESVVVINIHAKNSFGTGFCLDNVPISGKNTTFVATADHVTMGENIKRYMLNMEAATMTSRAGRVSPIGDAFVRYKFADMAAFSCNLDLKPLTLAKETPAIGESIYTLGHPLGDEYTISSGIVSGYNFDSGIPKMQITAPISPGSSGGPVLNQWGEVVGIVSSYKKAGQNLNQVVSLSEIIALRYRLHTLARTS